MSAIDPQAAGVSERAWREATRGCFPLRVARVVEETPDARSLVLEVPDEHAERFRYRAGQFLGFKVPLGGVVLTRSYSLASSPDCDAEHKVTVERVAGGRVSNWIHDAVREGDLLMATPPSGRFVLNPKRRPITFFAGGSGVTPCIALVKTALATTGRRLRLFHASPDERSAIFRAEVEALARRHPERLESRHFFDDRDGRLGVRQVEHLAVDALEGDFYLCGPAAFMDTLERALAALHVPDEQVHLERFVSPPDPGRGDAGAAAAEAATEALTIVLDGREHEVACRPEERVLAAARRAGLDPPSSCEEGYCSCCMAKLTDGRVRMLANDCLGPELLAEGWVLTCQSVCTSRGVRIEYPE